MRKRVIYDANIHVLDANALSDISAVEDKSSLENHAHGSPPVAPKMRSKLKGMPNGGVPPPVTMVSAG